jgi:phosphotransferase system  glucose/maltose/N-acetylglucosamine-specific IIC component
MPCIVYSLTYFYALLEPYLFYTHIFSCYLEKIFMQVFYENDRKSMLGGCFSFLVISNFSMRTDLLLLHMLELDVIFLHSMFLLFFHYYFFNKKKGEWGRCNTKVFFFFFICIAFQISHVFLSNISVLCTLMKYVYI